MQEERPQSLWSSLQRSRPTPTPGASLTKLELQSSQDPINHKITTHASPLHLNTIHKSLENAKTGISKCYQA